LEYVNKYASQKELDPLKLMKNIETLCEIATHYASLEDFYTQIALFAGETQSSKVDEGVKVMTIHSSKGLEWKYVFLPFWVRGNIPSTGF
jgi:DNA helicase-2/ATP-dependent DNA helicase PcrA